MKRDDSTPKPGKPWKCRVRNYNFSPKGGLEGLIVEAGGKVAQVVCPPHLGEELAGAVAEGAEVELNVEPAPPSDKGPAAHPVYHLTGVPETGPTPRVAGFRGVVARFNYAKHGEANGVVLDTGDFVHLKPGGMRQVGLKVGDEVVAEGDSRPMEFGGRVVEASLVNGRAIQGKSKAH